MEVSIQHTTGRTVYCVIWGIAAGAFWRTSTGTFDSSTYNASNHKISMTESALGTLTTIGMYRVSGGVSTGVAAFSDRIIVMIFDDAESPALLGSEQTEVDTGYEFARVAKTPNQGVSLVADTTGFLTAKISVGTGTGQVSLSSGAVLVQQGTAAGQLDTTSGQVKIQSGTGAGQLNVSSGVVQSDSQKWAGQTIPTPAVTGVPKVDATYWLGSGVAHSPAGIPNVNVTHHLGTAAAVPTVAGVPKVETVSIGSTAVTSIVGGITTTYGAAFAHLDANVSDAVAAASAAETAADAAEAAVAALVIPTAVDIAEAVLSLDVATIEATASVRSLCFIVLANRESSLPSAGSTWTVFQTDGVTTFDTLTIGRAVDGTVESIAG